MVWTLLLNYALTLSKVYSMSTDYVDQKTVFKNILSHYKITRNINDYGHRFVKKKGGGTSEMWEFGKRFSYVLLKRLEYRQYKMGIFMRADRWL